MGREPHPSVRVEASLSTSGYKAAGLTIPSATRRRTADFIAMADTGCQACCMGITQLHSLGLSRDDLLSPELQLNAANSSDMKILGSVFLKITGITPKGRRVSTDQEVYVGEGSDQLLLSRQACRALEIIEENFPTVGSHGSPGVMMTTSTANDDQQDIMDLPTPCTPGQIGSCSCPRREAPPPPPTCPPGIITTENTHSQSLCSFNIQQMHKAALTKNGG